MYKYDIFTSLCKFTLLLFVVDKTQTASIEGLTPAEKLKQCSLQRLNKCYVFSDSLVNYFEASKTCREYGGKLASISDQATQNFINNNLVEETSALPCRELVSSYGYCFFWFNRYTNHRKSVTYFTEDGTATTYTNWKPGQPDLTSRRRSRNPQMCATLNAIDGFWYDEDCTNSLLFVCEAEGIHCNVTKIHIPKAYFDFCLEDKLVPMGTTLNIQCKEGYELRGNNTIICGANGIWSDNPSCKKINPAPVLIRSKSITEYDNIGSSNVVLFDPGHVVETEQTKSNYLITCSDRNTWEREFKCEPLHKFQLITIGVKNGSEIILQCQLPDASIVCESWLWQKNSKAVNVQNGYTTYSNGSLQIRKFHLSHEGIYTCFALTPRFAASNVSFHLKQQSACLDITQSSKKHIFEGKSLILNCPHDEIEGVARSFRWNKDESPLIQTERVFVVADGSLVIPSVIFSDRGNYSCDVSWESGTCNSRISTELSVEASAESICGNPSMMVASPWTVTLYLEEEDAPFCYGALIDNKWVITSAYCVYPYIRRRGFKMFVRFDKHLPENGEAFFKAHTKTTTTTTNDNIRYVESIKLHPQYSSRMYANDVALVKLRTRISFTDEIQPICLIDKDISKPDRCESYRVVEGIVSGWGYLDLFNAEDAKFQTENMTVVEDKPCQTAATEAAVKFSDSIFCATANTPDINVYSSSVGSPFVVQEEDRVYLTGIFMVGERFSDTGSYDYFTKITKYVSWIRTMIR